MSYRENNFNGLIEDGSQRCFFPNGFTFYCYANKLFDTSVTYEALEEDYFKHAYGDQWQLALSYLKAVDEYMPQTYMEAKHTSRIPNNFYNPEMEAKLLALVPVAKEFEEKLHEHRNMPVRVQTVAMRLLKLHAEYVQGLAQVMALKSLGKDEEAKDAAKAFFAEFGKHEVAIERYYDHMLMVHAMNVIFNSKSSIDQ